MVRGSDLQLANIQEDTELPISGEQLVNSFRDVEGQELSLTSITLADESVGVLEGTPEQVVPPNYKFRPAANFNGRVEINYTVSDGETETSAKAFFEVLGVNDAPVFNTDPAAAGNQPAQNLNPTDSSPVVGDPLSTIEELRRCEGCLLYTSPSPRDLSTSRMPSSA